MEVIQNNIDKLNATITIKVKPEDYKESYDNGLKMARKNVSIPGFRPGHVPMGLVKKKYGASILAEEMNKLVSESLNKHITENKLNVLGNPIPKEDDKGGDWENPSDFEFNYEIGLSPDFEVKISAKDKYDFYKIKVGDDMIDKEIENMRRRYGKLEPVEESGDNDMILGQFVELDENGTPKEGGVMHTASVSVEFLDDDAAKKMMTGVKVGDTLKVDPKDISKGDADMAAMLGVKQEELVTLNQYFNFTATEIKRMSLAEIDQEFFDKIFGEGNITSEEELRSKISDDLSQMFVNDSNRMFKRDASEQLVKKLKLDLPDTFLKRWIKMSNDKPVTEEQIESEYEGYSNGLRWQLIENKIIEDNDLKVEHEEVMNYTKGLIANNFQQYGMPIPPEEELNKNALSVLENKEEAQRIYQSLYDAKVMEYMKNTVKLVEKEVTYDEFVKLASKEV